MVFTRLFSALLLAAILAGWTSHALAAQVAYPLVPGLSASTVYTMTVNGTSVPVQKYNGNSFAWFAFSGTANVVVTASATVASYTLSPLRNPVASTKSGATVTFTLTDPRHLVLHKVNAIAEKLFIFGDALEVSPPASSGSGIFNIVTGYGADNTGATSSRLAIQNAIDAATSFGTGAVVYVPAGLYTVNASIFLKDNVHLYLAPGAVIKNLTGAYTSTMVYHVNNVDNVRISGRGVLYGNGTTVTSYSHLMETGASSGTVTNFTMQDVMLLDSYSTALSFANMTNSTVTNIKILSGSPGLSDGIDADGVTNVTVDHAFIWSTDDNIAIGSGASAFSFGVATNTDGYTIKNSLFYQSAGGKVLSSVPTRAAEIKNVLFENNDVIKATAGFAWYASNGPADLHHSTIRNVRIEEISRKNIDMISTDFTTWGGCPNGFCISNSGKVHHITFDNVVFDTLGTTNGQISGRSATQNIDTINLNAVYMAGTLVTNAATGRLTIGAFVSNVTYTNTTADTDPPAAPTNLFISRAVMP